MSLNNLITSAIAWTAITLPPIANTLNAMANIQSSPSNPTVIEAAGRTHRNLFIAYVLWLLASGLVTAVFTYLVWRASNRQQDAVMVEANARIEESKAVGNQANEHAQAANERAQNLEHDNLTLRGQVATLEKQAVDASKDVARLQKDAADAKATQQKVEIDLSNAISHQQRIQTELARQQEKAAEAERALEAERQERKRLEEAVAPRTFVNTLMTADVLKHFPDVKVIIEYVDEDEPRGVAQHLSSTLAKAGWHIIEAKPVSELFPNITVFADSKSESARALVAELGESKIEAWFPPIFSLPPDTIRISIGRREAGYLMERRRNELYRDFLFGEPRNPIIEPLRERELRNFTEAQQRQFAEALKKMSWAAKYPVQLRCPANNDEMCGLAAEIGVLLRRSGWQIQDNSIIRDRDFPSLTGREYPVEDMGIVVVARWPDKSDSARALAVALDASGLSAIPRTDRFDRSAPLLIIVARKKPKQ
jgi:hypothetical protein